jgi:hypothetical protein
MSRQSWLLIISAGLFLGAIGLEVCSWGQQPAAAGSRFEFEVVQSFDAKYEGDTPGHVGRSGGLENRKLHVGLGDPIFRGDQQVGKVTGLSWSRAHGSLEVEFDPVADARVCVGDVVWLALDGKPQPAAAR